MSPLQRASQFYDATIGRASKSVSRLLSRSGERISARVNKNAEILTEKKEDSSAKIKGRNITKMDGGDTVGGTAKIADAIWELSSQDCRQIIGELFELLRDEGGLTRGFSGNRQARRILINISQI